MNKTLTYMDGETLMNTVLPPIRFVISHLLPQGLHVLAGAPKVGKSWLSLWLCLQVAKGEPVWEFPTTQGDVLYLCLEDSYSRIKTGCWISRTTRRPIYSSLPCRKSCTAGWSNKSSGS